MAGNRRGCTAAPDATGALSARDASDRLLGEPVEREHGELDVLLPRVLELRVREAAQALDEEHDRRDAGAGALGGVVERAAWEAVRRAGDFANRLVGELEQLVVEQDRLDVPD